MLLIEGDDSAARCRRFDLGNGKGQNLPGLDIADGDGGGVLRAYNRKITRRRIANLQPSRWWYSRSIAFCNGSKFARLIERELSRGRCLCPRGNDDAQNP